MTTQEKPFIDGVALIHAKGTSRARFEKLVSHYRGLGATDRDIVRAMMEAPGVINPLRYVR
jgi:hypothetical protein